MYISWRFSILIILWGDIRYVISLNNLFSTPSIMAVYQGNYAGILEIRNPGENPSQCKKILYFVNAPDMIYSDCSRLSAKNYISGQTV